MIKPERLYPGDRAAIVSLSWGGLGEPKLIHRYLTAKKRLERDFGLIVEPTAHALSGEKFLSEHPEIRARDLIAAFRDPQIKAVFCAIGGDDTIRTLKYVDLDVLRQNPKIFVGYSDSTINHFMMQKAGLISFYGISAMCELAENRGINPYTENALRAMLFEDSSGFEVRPSPVWSRSHIEWDENNNDKGLEYIPDTHGYELLSGSGKVRGKLIGGCLDVFMMAAGTKIFPTPRECRGAILLLETSEDKPSPEFFRYTLRNLAAQGILRVLSAIIVGKPQDETYYEEYKKELLGVVAGEEGLDIPILYNVNIGHSAPVGLLALGAEYELDCEAKTLTLCESATLPRTLN